MVRLFRGDRGRGMPRLPPMMQRPMRPHGFKPDFITPFGVPRPRLMRGHPVRPGLRPPLPRHGMIPPPLHPRPPPIGIPHPPPLHPSERPLPMQILRRPPPMNFPGRIPGMPPPHPHGPPLGRPLGSGPPFLRGRGGPLHRGVAVKRLGPVANGKAKKVQKRKEKTEEMEVNKPWVNEALKLEIQKKYQLYETAKEKKQESDWQAYKEQRILVGKMTNTVKLEYIGLHPEVDVDQVMFGATPKG